MSCVLWKVWEYSKRQPRHNPNPTPQTPLRLSPMNKTSLPSAELVVTLRPRSSGVLAGVLAGTKYTENQKEKIRTAAFFAENAKCNKGRFVKNGVILEGVNVLRSKGETLENIAEILGCSAPTVLQIQKIGNEDKVITPFIKVGPTGKNPSPIPFSIRKKFSALTKGQKFDNELQKVSNVVLLHRLIKDTHTKGHCLSDIATVAHLRVSQVWAIVKSKE